MSSSICFKFKQLILLVAVFKEELDMLFLGSLVHIVHKITFIAHQSSAGTTDSNIFLMLCF